MAFYHFVLLFLSLAIPLSADYVSPSTPVAPIIPAPPVKPFAPPVTTYTPPPKATAPPYRPPPKATVPPVKPYTPPPKATVPPVKPYTPPPKTVSPPVVKPPTGPSPPPQASAPPLVSPPAPAPFYGRGPPVKKDECVPLCEKRCGLHSRKRLCVRACSTCCARCKCVPPGTYGNKEVCGRCWTDMTTHGGRSKCP